MYGVCISGVENNALLELPHQLGRRYFSNLIHSRRWRQSSCHCKDPNDCAAKMTEVNLLNWRKLDLMDMEEKKYGEYYVSPLPSLYSS